MIALRAYFDSSGQLSDNYMTLAGFAASEELWSQFDADWADILKRHSPKAAYVHMRELAHQQGGFDSNLGWTNETAFGLSNNCLVYMSHLDKTRFRMFYCAVDLMAWRRLKDETYQLPGPIDLCTETCFMGIFVWYVDKYPEVLNLHGDSLELYFDQGEPFKGSFENRWILEKQKYRQTKIWNNWQMIKKISTVDMKAVPGIQAADILAWAVNRDANVSTGKGKYFRHIMQQVIPASFAVWNEDKLRKHHKRLLYF